MQEAVANDHYFNNFEDYIRYKEILIAKLIGLGFVKSKKTTSENTTNYRG